MLDAAWPPYGKPRIPLEYLTQNLLELPRAEPQRGPTFETKALALGGSG